MHWKSSHGFSVDIGLTIAYYWGVGGDLSFSRARDRRNNTRKRKVMEFIRVYFLSYLIFCVSGASTTPATASKHKNSTTTTTTCSIDQEKFRKFFKSHIIIQPNKYITIKPLTCLSCNDKYHGAVVAFLCPYHRDPITIASRETSKWGNEAFCTNLSRTGPLCSRCNNSSRLALSSYSARCVEKKHCHNYHWLTFFAVETLPVTLMYIVLVAFSVNLLSGYANTYIIYSQFIAFQLTASSFHHGSQTTYYKSGGITTDVVVSLYRLWSFQLGHEISAHLCVCNELEQLMTMSLQYTSVFYALLLAVLGYILAELHSHQYRLVIWLSKPFSWCFHFRDRSVDAKTVSLNTLAGFYYIGFAKLASVSLLLLASTPVYNETGGQVDHVCFYDSSKSFMKSGHVPYAVLAITVLTLLGIFPIVFMILYSFRFFRKCLEKCHLNRPGLIILMNAFQGCYRDGTEGRRDCRWFSSYYYIFRLAIFYFGVTFVDDNIVTVELHLFLLILILFSITVLLGVMPYKSMSYNKLDIFMFSYSSFVLAITSYEDLFVTKEGVLQADFRTKCLEIFVYLFIAFPLVCAAVYVLEKLFGVKIRFLIRWYRRYTSRDYDTNQSLSVINDTPPPLLRTISGTSTSSLPDRMIQPEVYQFNSRGTTPDYGSVHRSLLSK